MRSLHMAPSAAQLRRQTPAIAPFPWPVAPPPDLRQLSPPAGLARNRAAMAVRFVHASYRRTAPVAAPAMTLLVSSEFPDSPRRRLAGKMRRKSESIRAYVEKRRRTAQKATKFGAP